MNTPSSAPLPDDAFDDAAAAWLCERDAGFAPGRERAFAAWRDADPRHAAAVIRVEQALTLLGEMPAVRAPLEARFGATDEIGATTALRPRRRTWMLGAAAGLAAALVVGFAAWWMISARVAPEERYVAEPGAARRVTLGDGSTVDLNRGSEVRVSLSRRDRAVTLLAGEAHFQVAHDASRPFVVSAAGMAVRAVGTAFNVKLAGSAVDVLVVEGKVEVTAARAPAQPTTPPPQLEAGERAVLDRAAAQPELRLERVAPESIRAALAWQNSQMTFNDVPLRDVVQQFNRRNETQLLLAEPALGERRIGGVIALDQVEAFVRLLEQDGDIVGEHSGGNRIVLRHAR